MRRLAWSYYKNLFSFKAFDLLFLERKIIKGFTIYGHGGNLGHVIHLIYKHFFSLAPV